MAFIDEWNLVNDKVFRGRVSIALFHAALQILEEDPETVNHAARVQVASSVRSNPEGAVQWFILYVATNPNIASMGPVSSNDSDISWVISSVWDLVATS